MQAIIGKKIDASKLVRYVLEDKEKLKQYLINTFEYTNRNVDSRSKGSWFYCDSTSISDISPLSTDHSQDHSNQKQIDDFKYNKDPDCIYTEDVDKHVDSIWNDNTENADPNDDYKLLKIRTLNLIRFTARWSVYSRVFINLTQYKYKWENLRNNVEFSYKISAFVGFDNNIIYKSGSFTDGVIDLEEVDFIVFKTGVSSTLKTIAETRNTHLKQFEYSDEDSKMKYYIIDNVAFDIQDYDSIIRKLTILKNVKNEEGNDAELKVNPSKSYRWTDLNISKVEFTTLDKYYGGTDTLKNNDKTEYKWKIQGPINGEEPPEGQ